MSEEEDEFQSVVTHCLTSLLLGIETRLEAALSAMARINWGSMEMVGWQQRGRPGCRRCRGGGGASLDAAGQRAAHGNSRVPVPRLVAAQAGDQSEYVGTFRAVLLDCGARLGPAMPPNYFRFFCDKLLRSFAPRYWENVFRCRKISDIGCQQVGGQ